MIRTTTVPPVSGRRRRDSRESILQAAEEIVARRGPAHLTLETAANDSVPANVESCLNVYQSSSAEDWLPAFRGLPITVESASTQLVNYNLRFHDEGVARADLNHFTVCKNYGVLGMVTDHVTAALRLDGSQADSPGGTPGGPIGDGTGGEPASQVAATRMDSTRAGVDERFLPFE